MFASLTRFALRFSTNLLLLPQLLIALVLSFLFALRINTSLVFQPPPPIVFALALPSVSLVSTKLERQLLPPIVFVLQLLSAAKDFTSPLQPLCLQTLFAVPSHHVARFNTRQLHPRTPLIVFVCS